MIDIHSHILSGLDDGAQSLAESIEMAKIAADDGITKIVATPHMFRNNFDGNNIGAITKILSYSLGQKFTSRII